jgi:CDP-diacylglycerol--serine O-phosphatidyltransferase
MRLRSLASKPTRPRRRRRTLRTVQLLPSALTAGNLVAGVLACAYMVDAGGADAAHAGLLFERAAWLIFIGMLMDGLDGRVARLTGTTSAFGAQLDSLADVVSFGVAPALLAKTLLTASFPALSGRLVFALCLTYVLGAAFRLARYNVESERTRDDERPHVTRVFRGLPSPAAAGVIASLVLLRREFAVPPVQEAVDWSLLAAAPLLGTLMVSRMPYTHVLNRYFGRRRAHPTKVVALILLVYLGISHFVETVTTLFLVYACWGPVLTLLHRVFGGLAWVEREDEDEEEEVEEIGDGFEELDEDGREDPEKGPGTGTEGPR